MQAITPQSHRIHTQFTPHSHPIHTCLSSLYATRMSEPSSRPVSITRPSCPTSSLLRECTIWGGETREGGGEMKRAIPVVPT